MVELVPREEWERGSSGGPTHESWLTRWYVCWPFVTLCTFHSKRARTLHLHYYYHLCRNGFRVLAQLWCQVLCCLPARSPDSVPFRSTFKDSQSVRSVRTSTKGNERERKGERERERERETERRMLGENKFHRSLVARELLNAFGNTFLKVHKRGTKGSIKSKKVTSERQVEQGRAHICKGSKLAYEFYEIKNKMEFFCMQYLMISWTRSLTLKKIVFSTSMDILDMPDI